MAALSAVVGLDIGHAMIRACIGRIDDGRIHIFGRGAAAADGIEKGAVVDEQRLKASIAHALELAEHASHVRTNNQVVVGVGGALWRGSVEAAAAEAPIERLAGELGLSAKAVVPSAQAAARAVLLPAERTEQTAVVDVGEESTDVVVFRGGEAVLHAVVPVGGRHVTNDIAYGLKVTVDEAEQLKRRFGAAIRELEASVQANLGDSEDGPTLLEIVEARVAELFELVAAELKSAFGGAKAERIVLTGGSALLAGIQHAAQSVLEVPVRIGVAQATSGPADVVTSPAYAAAIGLLYEFPLEAAAAASANGAGRRSLLGSVKEWLSEFLKDSALGGWSQCSNLMRRKTSSPASKWSAWAAAAKTPSTA